MLGNFLVVAALLAGLYSTFKYFKAYYGEYKNIIHARYAYHAMTVLVIIASTYLLYLILTHQYQYKYIFEYSSGDLSFGLLLSTFFAGQEGSFLLWLLFTVVIGLFLQNYTSKRGDLEARVMMVYTLAAVFLLVMVNPLLKSPFNLIWSETNYVNIKYFNQSILGMPAFKNFIFDSKESNENFVKVGTDLIAVLNSNGIEFSQFLFKGKGLNPLLQNFWMQIHPPILFLGFALTTVPFAFAVSSLIKNKYDEWIKLALPWTLFTCVILGLGIMIGGYWAYGVLGWGGYWAWDPVENASLVPWIINVALIHTMLIQKQTQVNQRIGRFAKTNLVLAVLMFVLVIYSTFLTRSGILSDSSVHSFSDPGTIVYSALLIYILTFSLIGFGGVYIRRKSLKNFTDGEENILSRETVLFYGAALLVASATVVFVGTSAPLIGQSVETDFYNQMNLPLVFAMSLLIGISLFLNWKFNDSKIFIKNLLTPVIISVLFTSVIILLSKLNDVLYILFLFSNIFALVVNFILLVKVLKSGYRFWGGHLSHIGFAVFLIGVLISGVFSESRQVELTKGVKQNILSHELTFVGMKQIENGKKYAFDVAINNENKSFLSSPVMYISDFNNSLMREPDIIEGLLSDFYVSPTSYTDNKESGNNGSAVSATLRKEEKFKFKDAELEFVGFNLPDHSSDGMTQGNEIIVGTKINVYYKNKVYSVEPRMKVIGDKKEFGESIIKEADLKIKLTSLDVAGSVNLILSSASNKSVTPITPNEVLAADISVKPFISLVWIGVFIMSVGIVIVTLRRSKEV